MDRGAAMRVLFATDEQGASVPCDVTFCTLSLTRRTGGEIKTLRGVVTTGSKADLQRSRMVNLVPKEDRGQRRGTETHVHLCLIMAINGEYINGSAPR